MSFETLSWLRSTLQFWVTHYTFTMFMAVTILYVIHWVRVRRYKHSLFARLGIPFIKPHLIYGSMRQMRGKTLASELVGEWINKYGNIFGYYIGAKPHVVVRDLDLVRQVLVKDFHNFSNRPKLAIEADPVMDCLVGLRDQRWKDIRSVLTPTFSMSKMKLMIGIMNKRVDEFLEILSENHKKDKPTEMYAIFQGLTLDVICECVLAMKTNCQREQNDNMFFACTRHFLKNAVNPAIELAIYFSVFSKIFAFISNRLAFSGRMTNMIVDHVKTVLSIRKKDTSNTKYIDVLQLMMDASKYQMDVNENGETILDQNLSQKEEKSDSSKASSKPDPKNANLTDEEIVANAWVFLLAGFETTAGSMCSTAYLLACNQDIQEKLYQELCEHFEDGHESLTYETVHKLTYLDQVFAEALRILPPVVMFISRDTNEDYQLGDYFIPNDTNILIPIWQIHHDPELWPDPWKFDPDRFSPEAKATSTRHPMAYMPFGQGPRGCPGIRFAQLETKLTLARLIRSFRLETCEDTPIPITFAMPTVTHIPAKDVMIRAVPRE